MRSICSIGTTAVGPENEVVTIHSIMCITPFSLLYMDFEFLPTEEEQLKSAIS